MTIVGRLQIARQLRAAVVHHDAQPLGHHRRRDPHAQSRSGVPAAVLDGVFRQRLQQQRRQVHAQRLGARVDGDAQSIGKARLLHGQVSLQSGQLGGHIDPRPVAALQGVAQKITEAREHGGRLPGTVVDQHADRMQ